MLSCRLDILYLRRRWFVVPQQVGPEKVVLMKNVCGICWVLLLLTAASVCHAQGQSTQIDFDRAIAPLLARRCLDCHNSSDRKGGLDLSQKSTALKGGESGRVIVAGNAGQSLLWQRIDDDEMPPKKPLSATEKAILKTWIVAGARWGTERIDPFRFTTDSRAGYDWWALQPVVRPELPNVGMQNWSKHPIDQFALAGLEEKKLSPSSPADRRTLIRRLSFGLLGLPPSPEHVTKFVNDKSADSYEQLVERMLQSPHYGERWARHWLDIARFGESQGFERDKIRLNSWRYRDWVIQALNDDMPYDEFARMQLAGDVLKPGDASATIATGFLVAGAYDEVGNSQQSAAMKAVVRQDELEDIVSAVGQTFLGLTVHCARCHDHKFDPVTQKEYYQLASALGGVRHGERQIKLKPIGDGWLSRRIEELQKQITVIESPVRLAILAERKVNRQKRPRPPKPIARWTFDNGLKDELGNLNGTAHGDASIKDGALQLSGKSTCYVSTAPLQTNLKEKTLEAWVSLSNLTQRGGGVVSLQGTSGGQFDAIVFGEREPGRWMAGSNGFVRTKSFSGPEEREADRGIVHVAITYHADGTITGYRNGQPYGKSYKSSGPVTYDSGKSNVLFGLRHSPTGGNRMLSGAIDRAQLYDRALSAGEVAASAGVDSDYIPEGELLARMTDKQRERHQRIRFELGQLKTHAVRQKSDRVYAVNPSGRPADVVRLLVRGNTTQPADLVSAGGVKALQNVEPDFGLQPDAPDNQRRKKLAEWITDRRNPLFARVIANRLWHYHFGVGLVDSPSDFGFNGGRPTHPQLIDWLAADLIANDFSLKHLHKTIVMSATYRQSSRFRAAAAKVDAANRFLWRKTPMRLDAESLRDTILKVAGQLNHNVGGPGFYDFTTFVRNTQFYEMRDPVGDLFNRRSVYRTWVRSGRNRFLDAFDCPDPSAKAPKRAVTTTPIQSLALLNNSFVLRMSQRFADRIRQDAGNDVSKQIERAFDLAYNRMPEADERALLDRFVNQHGLAPLCRVIFNSNEFLYVD